MTRVGRINWEWCVRMCMSEEGILVVSAPGMATPLEADQRAMSTIWLSSVEGGVSALDIAPACGCLDSPRFPGGELQTAQIFVSGTVIVPQIEPASNLGSVREGGSFSARVFPEAQDMSAGESDQARSDSDIEAEIVSEIQFILRMRRARSEFFEQNLFADPAWDMMLDLMEARLRGTEILTSSLCMAASVPASTALRWIKNLTEKGILVRRADAGDKRRVYVALSDAAASAMNDWFELFHRQKTAGRL